MKIGFIADLHIDRNFELQPKDYTYELLKLIDEKEIVLLVIGGDIANHYSLTLTFVEDLQKQAGIPVYFIPGNHDFWEEKKDRKTTLKIYDMYANHPQSLLESPKQLTDAYTLVGHTAWYNHAVYDKEAFSQNEIEKGKYRWTYWQDKLRMDWQASDGEVSTYFTKKIQEDLKKVTTDKIILQTHVVTIPEFTMPMPHRVFDFFNAYIATNDLKDIHKEHPITHNFMGHVHFRGKVEREGTKFITNSLGYRKEWRSRDIKKELRKSLVILEI